MGKKRKKTPASSATPSSQAAPPSNPSNEIQLTDILESIPAPAPSATEAAAPVVITPLAAAPTAPEPPVSRPAITEEKAAEIIAASSSPEIAKVEEPKVEAAIEKKEEEAAPMSEAAPASEVAPESEAVASEAAPSTVAPKKKKKTKKRVSRASLDKKIDRLEAKLADKKEEAAKAAREGFGSNPALEDDTSVPPVDLEVHDDFFAAGEKAHLPPTKESGAYSAVDARHAQKMTAQARARRAHLSRYVLWAVSGAAAILFLGIAIKTFRHQPNDEPVRRDITHVAQATTPPEQQTGTPQTNVANNPPPVTEVDEVKVDDSKTDEVKDDKVATNDSADAKAPAVADEKKADMPTEAPKTAYQEKVTAKAALERGANGTAISAGERSVALDASDGEAWLVLGGAYQAMGNNSQAKRCYKACVSQGKKGPISDCRDMLSSL